MQTDNSEINYYIDFFINDRDNMKNIELTYLLMWLYVNPNDSLFKCLLDFCVTKKIVTNLLSPGLQKLLENNTPEITPSQITLEIRELGDRRICNIFFNLLINNNHDSLQRFLIVLKPRKEWIEKIVEYLTVDKYIHDKLKVCDLNTLEILFSYVGKISKKYINKFVKSQPDNFSEEVFDMIVASMDFTQENLIELISRTGSFRAKKIIERFGDRYPLLKSINYSSFGEPGVRPANSCNHDYFILLFDNDHPFYEW